jgi:hypothetical protein
MAQVRQLSRTEIAGRPMVRPFRGEAVLPHMECSPAAGSTAYGLASQMQYLVPRSPRVWS